MCNSQLFAILLILLLLYFLFASSRSNFEFDNSDYQYSNPSKDVEKSYYGCLFRECRGDTRDFNCLEKCKFQSFHSGESKDIRDRMCDYLPQDERWDCLNNLYQRYGYNVSSDVNDVRLQNPFL